MGGLIGSLIGEEENPQDRKLDLEPVDLTPLIESNKYTDDEQLKCGQELLKNLRQYGIVITKDKRVPFELNKTFQMMMEDYFNQPVENKMKDTRPKLHFQVGATPEKQEKARERCSEINTYDPSNKPVTLCPPEADLKWRYFWRIGETPDDSEFIDLNMEPVIPEGFPQWKDLCNKFGEALLSTSLTIAEGVALAYGLPRDYFTEKMYKAPHLLAPTGSDLNEYAKKDAIFAGYHSDLNFLTTHGKSNFPGLFIWLRDGTKYPVTMPDGCLLTQAGMQIEHMTGGDIFAGMHEVICYEKTLAALQRQRDRNRPLWRVSTTLFSHIRSTQELEPIEQFKNSETEKKYPKILAGDHVLEQLRLIGLLSEQDAGGDHEIKKF